MMSEPNDVVAYLHENYPRSKQLNDDRMMKMFYLADWKSAIENGRQLTDLLWTFGNRGPHCIDAARAVDLQLLDTSQNDTRYPSLTAEDRRLLDFVIHSVEEKDSVELNRLVYSTYPIFTSERYSQLDLVTLAKDYEKIRPLLGDRS